MFRISTYAHRTFTRCKIYERGIFSNWCNIRNTSLLTTCFSSYNSKFTEPENEKILETINNSDPKDLARFQLTSPRINKLVQYRENKGKFNKLSQVLDVDGLGVKVIDKFFKSIIDYRNGSEGEEKKQTKLKARGQLIIPAISEVVLENISSAVGIHIGVNSICWSKLQRDKRLITDWEMASLLNNTSKKTNIDIFQLVLQIVKNIPFGDVYILEAAPNFSPSAQQQPMSILAYIHYTQICSILLTLLNTNEIHNPDFNIRELNDLKETTGLKNKVHFLRSKLPARLFRTLIGTERVSAENVVDQILNKSDTDIMPVKFDNSVRIRYESCLPIDKEIMGQALLLILTFMDLFVYQIPGSLKKIAPGNKN